MVQRSRSIQKTGHGFADQIRYWPVHLGMGAQPVALQHEGLRLRVFKDPRKGSPMPHLTEFFDNVQLPTMPDVARDLVATMQDDDILFEKVLLAEIGLEEPKSPADTIASLPEEIKRALPLDSAWLAEHLPPVADFVDVSVR